MKGNEKSSEVILSCGTDELCGIKNAGGRLASAIRDIERDLGIPFLNAARIRVEAFINENPRHEQQDFIDAAKKIEVGALVVHESTQGTLMSVVSIIPDFRRRHVVCVYCKDVGDGEMEVVHRVFNDALNMPDPLYRAECFEKLKQLGIFKYKS